MGKKLATPNIAVVLFLLLSQPLYLLEKSQFFFVFGDKPRACNNLELVYCFWKG